MIFENRATLRASVLETVDAIRAAGEGRYACLFDAGAIVLESPPEPEDGRLFALRQLVEERRPAILALPEAMAGAGPSEDVFADWHEDEFLLALLNQRVALLVACPDAEALANRSAKRWSASTAPGNGAAVAGSSTIGASVPSKSVRIAARSGWARNAANGSPTP